MGDIFSFARKTGFGVALGAVFGLFAFGQAAEAANPLELNFGLFGPKYEGRLKACEAALGTITSQFQEKESTFWNSRLTITAYGRIHEIAYRPWQSDNIPRRYCSGDVMLSDGAVHGVHLAIAQLHIAAAIAARNIVRLPRPVGDLMNPAIRRDREPGIPEGAL